MCYVGGMLFAFVRSLLEEFFVCPPHFTHSAEAVLCVINILRILNETEKNN